MNRPDEPSRCGVAGLPDLARASLPLRTAADPDPHAGVTLFESLQAKGFAVGTVVQSTAGHDYSRLGIVIAMRPPFALVADGQYRPSDRPKRKRLTHLRPVARVSAEALALALALPDAGQRDSAVRRLIETAVAPLRSGAQAAAPPSRQPEGQPEATTVQAP